jgi:hypothetical protein
MPNIMAGAPLKISFNEEERSNILEVATERSKIGAEYRNTLHLYVDGEASNLNAIGNHITGELTERAVATWLTTFSITHTRPTSLKEELDNNLADITTAPKGIVIDVKSTISGFENFLLRADQNKQNAPNLAIIWCKPYRPHWEFENYNIFVPEWAKIYGWVPMAEAGNINLSRVQDCVHHFIHKSRLRTPETLLKWIRTGILPLHP